MMSLGKGSTHNAGVGGSSPPIATKKRRGESNSYPLILPANYTHTLHHKFVSCGSSCQLIATLPVTHQFHPCPLKPRPDPLELLVGIRSLLFKDINAIRAVCHLVPKNRHLRLKVFFFRFSHSQATRCGFSKAFLPTNKSEGTSFTYLRVMSRVL